MTSRSRKKDPIYDVNNEKRDDCRRFDAMTTSDA